MKLASVVGVGLFAMLALTGCINLGSGFSALDRAAEAGDALPTDLPGYAYDNVDPASGRLVAEHDGNTLYLAKAKEADRVCLLVYSNSTDWVIGCGGAPAFGAGGPSGSYLVRADGPDGAPKPDGYVEIAKNVFARE